MLTKHTQKEDIIKAIHVRKNVLNTCFIHDSNKQNMLITYILYTTIYIILHEIKLYNNNYFGQYNGIQKVSQEFELQ